MLVSYFLVMANDNGRLIPVGKVNNGSRLSMDESASKSFPTGTRARKDVLSACRWCLDRSKVLPERVSLEVKRGGSSTLYEVAPIKG